MKDNKVRRKDSQLKNNRTSSIALVHVNKNEGDELLGKRILSATLSDLMKNNHH